MKTPTTKAAIAAALILGSVSLALAEDRECGSGDPIETINEMFDAIYACWEPPAGSEGMSLTLTFSVRSNGTLIGVPIVRHSRLGKDSALREAFVESVFGALDRATPLPLSKSMGGAIAGRILAPRFAVPGRAI
ncbi:hypothetical protein GCM10011385_30160 [Nitratireductor aestuarii]|uniref:TonB C-terminal domain-containing protein n=1 Tax=Nitratireductor aestuarii TaxID=1735103 RepID=A0A916W7J8_9HYPH|nr:TonB C-terminal domain-containing protein [Nitratireductor aestuarii]GGA74130.1 hypothetical protein GCM10011385_30160 [Nitratireductor aestuarii]